MVPQINFSVDIVILLTVVLIVLCGLLLGHNKVKTFALSVYVGIVLATELGTSVFSFLTARGLSFATVGQVRMGLLILPIFILELGRSERYKRGPRGSFMMTLILSLLVAALIISSTLKLLEPNSLQAVLDQSNFAWPLYHWHMWWVASVPVAVLLESFMRGRER